MTPFFSRLSDRSLQTYWYLFVPDLDSGWYFTSSGLSLPTAGGRSAVTCLEIGALRTADATLSRKAGVANPKTLTLQLGPENSEVLTTVLATVGTNAGLRVEGLVAYLVMGLADHAGVPLDTTLWEGPGDGVPDYQCVVFAGPIESCQLGDSWYHWDLTVLSLEALLDTEVGGKLEGQLSPYGFGQLISGVIQGQPARQGMNKVHFRLVGTADGTAVNTVIQGDVEYLDAQGLASAMAKAANDYMTAEGLTPGFDYYVAVYNFNDPEGYIEDFKKGNFRVRFSLWVNPQLDPDGDLSGFTAEILPQEPDTAFPYCGYTQNQLQSVNDFSIKTNLFVADENPLAVWVSPKTRTLEVWLDDLQATPPAVGYLVLSNGDRKEIVRYSAISGATEIYGRNRYTVELFDGVTSGRAQFGTAALEIAIRLVPTQLTDSADWVVTTNESVLVKFAGAKQGHLFDIIGLLATNDGDASTPWRDATQPEGFCAGLDYQLLDTGHFAALAATNAIAAPFAQRSYAWTEASNLREWISQELSATGWTLQARTVPSSGLFQITLDQVTQPLLATVWSLTSTDLVQGGAVHIHHVYSGCANRANVEIVNDFGADNEAKYQVNFSGSQTRLKRVMAESYKVRGILPKDWQAEQIAAHFLGLLAPYAYPYELITLPLRRQHWQIQPGDSVDLTLASLPAPTGGRGWDAEPLVVIGVERALAPTGNEPPCVLLCLHAPDRRTSYYSPSARVVSWTAGTKTLVVEANAYSTAGDWILDPTQTAKDIRWFADAAFVQITQAANDSSTEEIAVVSVDGATNAIVLNAAPTFAPVAGDFVTLPAWDSRAPSEKRFVAIANAAGELGTNDDPAFTYGG